MSFSGVSGSVENGELIEEGGSQGEAIAPVQVQVRSLLVIDDDSVFCRFVSKVLQGEFQVDTVVRVSEDWDQQLRPDLDAILLDYKMDGKLNGLDLLKIIRAKVPRVPVFFTTGVGDFAIAREALQMGAVEYLPKPLSPSDLCLALSRHLDAYSIREDRGFILPFSEINSRSNCNQVWVRTEDGVRLSGDLQCFSWRSVYAEFGDTGEGFKVGENLYDVHIRLGARLIEVDEARVASSVRHSGRVVLQITMPGEWRSLPFPADVSELKQSEGFSGSSHKFENEESVLSAELKSSICNLADLIQRIHDELEPRQAYLLKGGAHQNLVQEEGFLSRVKNRIFPEISDAVQAFEMASVQAIEEGVETEYINLSHKRLYPVLLCSPFISRVVERPIGVPGDFDILGKILGDPFEGRSLLSRLINGWILTTTAAGAYRHRVNFLAGEIAALQSGDGNEVNVLSLGSGVAYEVQQLLQGGALSNPVNFTLVDFNEATLKEARSTLCELKDFHDASQIHFKFVQNSVKELLRDSEADSRGDIHLAYCAGLFDYLSDRVCILVIRYLFHQLAPGGRMVVCNFTPFNPIKHFMGLVLDWKLIHRSVEDLRELIQNAELGDSAQLSMMTETGQVEAYGIIDKSRNP